MMLDAVAFDLGCARSPLFAFPDASGLAPLTLPDEFLHGQSNQLQAELQPDTVQRFETAMSAESKLPPSVLESLMSHMSSESPTVAGQEIESLKSPTVEGLEAAIAKHGREARPARLQSRGTRDPAKCAGGFVIVSEVDSPKVKSPTVESLKDKNPTVEGLKVESQKSEVASVINPVSVERHMVVTVDTVVYGDSMVRSADEKLVVASPELPKAPMIAASEKQAVGIEQTPANIASRPVVVSVDKSVVENIKRTTVATIKVPTVAMVESPVAVDRPIDISVERSVRVAVEGPVVASVSPTIQEGSVARSADERPAIAAVEKPKTVAPTPAPIAAPVVLEDPDDPVKVELQPVVASSTPTVPVSEQIAIVETPAVVNKRTVVSVERSVRVAVEGPAIASVNSMIQEGSAVRSADERPMIATVERPMVESVDKPVAESVGRSTVVMVEVPTIATSEKPAAVVSSPAPTVAPVVLENPDDPVKVEGRPVVASSTPIAPVLEPTATVETPVAVDKPIDGSVERSVRVAVEGPVAASVNPMIQEGSVVRSADEKPMAATVERPVVVAPDKPTVVTVERPAVVAPDKPMVVTVERPVVVAPDKPTVVTVERPAAVAPDKPVFETAEKPVAIATPVAPTVVPAVQENPNDAVKTEGHPVVVSSTSIMPDALSTRPDVMVEAPVAVDKPIGASVEQSVQVIVPTPAEPTVIIEKAHPLSAERPVSAKIFQQTVATVDKPEGKESAASAHVVVTPTLVEVPSTLQGVQTAPEVAAASAASARTEAIVETVNQIVEAVVGQILITPGITHGECEIKIMLKPTVLDGSEITMSAKDGTLTVGITPATQAASAAAAAALPRLEIALAEHAPAFHHVSVALQLKKGNRNEAV